jgi:hypothetical protein
MSVAAPIPNIPRLPRISRFDGICVVLDIRVVPTVFRVV